MMPYRTKYQQTILVVEDEETDAFFIHQGLRQVGVIGPIQIVGSGSEAIAYLMGEGKFADRAQYAFPTFIMTDLKMPGGDGFEVLHHLKYNPEWSVIPTVVLTSSNEPDDVKKAYMLGASSYHVKPANYVALQQLLHVIHNYWITCCVPDVDATGRQLITDSAGRLGERYPQPSGGTQTRNPFPG